MSRVTANITTLSEEQIQQVHQSSLEVLSATGIRVDSKRARKVFSNAIGSSIQDEIVRIPAEIVNQAIKSAPSLIDIYTRAGNKLFSLGGDQKQGTIFGIGVTNSWYQDPMTDEVTPFSRTHVELAAKLGNTLSEYDVISTPGVIQTSLGELGEVTATLEMMANTQKALTLLVSDPRQFTLSLDLLEFLHGDLSEKPFILPYVNPITPLVLNKDTSNKMFATIERGLPFIFSSYGMSGATAPIMAASTLVLLNAELLAGLVFAQLIKAGTPVVLGILPSVFEMKNMISAYTTQTMLLNLACADMMNHYQVPHAGTSGSGTGWGADILGSGTAWMNHLTSTLGKVGLAPFVGGNFDSQAFSPAAVIYSNEVIRQARQFANGFELDDASMGLDEIHTMGPGGNFLVSPQTLDHYRAVHEQHSHIWPSFSLNQWKSEGMPKASEVFRNFTLDQMQQIQAPKDHNELIERGENFIRKQTNQY